MPLPDLIERVDERLEPGKVPDELEDPHDSHHPNQPHDLPRLAHDLKILQERSEKVSAAILSTSTGWIVLSWIRLRYFNTRGLVIRTGL